MILCRNGHENPDDATVCAVCGVPVGGALEKEVQEPPAPAQPEEVAAPAAEVVEISAPPEPPPAPELSAELRPPTSTGRTAWRHELLVHNAGAAVGTTTPVGSGGDALDVAVDPPTLTIAPGQSAVAQVQVAPRRPLWVGRARAFPFRLALTPDAGVDGAIVQQPRLPARVALPVAAVLAAVAIAIPLVAASTGGASDGCRAAGLNATFKELEGSGAAGSVVYILGLQNVSVDTCSVSGLVGMQLLGPPGELPTNVVAAGDPSSAPEVSLGPGDFASASARIGRVPGPDEPADQACQPTADRVLVLVPPQPDGGVTAQIDPPTFVCQHGRLEMSPLVPGQNGPS